MVIRIKGNAILITGGGSGIGRRLTASARRLPNRVELPDGNMTMATTNIEKVLTIFHGISAGDVNLATQHIDHKRFMEHNPCKCRSSLLPLLNGTARTIS